MTLIYQGGGFLPGVPARDLTDEDVKLYGERFLLATGLWKKPAAKRGQEDKGHGRDQGAAQDSTRA